MYTLLIDSQITATVYLGREDEDLITIITQRLFCISHQFLWVRRTKSLSYKSLTWINFWNIVTNHQQTWFPWFWLITKALRTVWLCTQLTLIHMLLLALLNPRRREKRPLLFFHRGHITNCNYESLRWELTSASDDAASLTPCKPFINRWQVHHNNTRCWATLHFLQWRDRGVDGKQRISLSELI